MSARAIHSPEMTSPFPSAVQARGRHGTRLWPGPVDGVDATQQQEISVAVPLTARITHQTRAWFNGRWRGGLRAWSAGFWV